MHPVAYQTAQNPKRRTICGVIHDAAEASREKRENRTKPQPWIVRKLMVGITTGIMGYAAYVYIRQLCLPMIWRRPGAPGSRGTGIALLVVFCVLYLWMIWAYFMVVITSPGYAKDHVPKSERPLIPAYNPFRESFQSTELSHHTEIVPPTPAPQTEDVEMGSYRKSFGRHRSFSATTSRSHSTPSGPVTQKRESGLAGPSYEDLLKRDAVPAQQPEAFIPETNEGMSDSIALPKPTFSTQQKPLSPLVSPSQLSSEPTSSSTVVPPYRKEGSTAPFSPPLKLKKPKPLLPAVSMISGRSALRREKSLKQEERLDALNITRKPPTSAVLQPVHRYCTVDGILKPYRSHHCRVCGTCVLKYDHHCPWIGQCVGARNQKFFLNFCQAAAVFTGYAMGTLIAYTIVSSDSPTLSDINPQEIVVIALAGIFFLFTVMLTITHIHLILSGQTTVESMQIRFLKDREERNLAKVYGFWQFGAKRRKIRQWDQEWGRISKEGHIWWRGSAYDEWVDVMGENPLGWIFPTLRKGGDGLEYPVNPRFDFEGRWRKRSEWPEVLR